MHPGRGARATTVAAVLLAALTAGCAAVTPTWTPRTASSTPAPPASPSPTPSTTPSPSPLAMVAARIPYGPERREQMADYSLRRYGERSADLTPHVIVVHFTESPDDPWVTINFFAANQPNAGTLPGVCTHFLIDKVGTIYDLVATDTRCRHAVGLNHVALGIEVVQSTEGHGSHWADDQILARQPQMDALIALIGQLQQQFSIPTDRVQGHGTADTDPEFKDLTGMRNDHTDIGPDAVAEIRRRLEATP